MKTITVKGKSLEECIEKLSNKLRCPASSIKNYKILKIGKSFLFGLIKTDYVVQYISYTNPVSDNYRINEALKIALDFDGFFTIDYQDGAAYLTVFPPGENGKSVEFDDIINKLKTINAQNIDETKIREALETTLKTPVKVADWPDGESFNACFKIEIASDKMTAYCILYPPKPGGKLLRFEDIINGLNNKGIISDIQTDVIKKAIENQEYNQKILVSKGRQPIDGEDAYLKFYFNAKKEINLVEKPNGRVDFKELNIIETVKKDTLLCEKIDPTSGIDGCDVFGKVLKAKPGKDLIIKNGTNTYIDAKKQKVYAARDGEPILNEAGEVSVNEICTIDGDVNYSTGNINFEGTVIIEGRVEDNFTVKATGDIVIKGNVGKSHIEAGGNIYVDGGIIGKNEAIIKSQKNVYAKFIESANVFAKYNIVCKKMIMHSNITAGVQVRVNGDRGALIGGTTRAGESVIVNELGAIGAAITTVEVGIKPEIIEKLCELENKKIEMQKTIDKINLGIQTLHKRESELGLSENEKIQILQLENMLKSATEKINSIKFEIIQIKRNSEINPKAKIQVFDKLYANVHTYFGNIQRNFSKEEVHVRLGLIDSKIVVLPHD